MKEKIDFRIRCIKCNKYHSISCTIDQYDQWKAGTYIQWAMPHLTVNERELMISKICGECFDKMYSGDGDE